MMKAEDVGKKYTQCVYTNVSCKRHISIRINNEYYKFKKIKGSI